MHLFSHHPEKSNQDLTGEEAQSYQPAAATTVESGDGIKFRCLECFCQFESWLALVGHVSVHGLSKLAVEDGEDGKSDATWKKSSRSQFKCELCYKSFSTEERLEVCLGHGIFYIYTGNAHHLPTTFGLILNRRASGPRRRFC